MAVVILGLPQGTLLSLDCLPAVATGPAFQGLFGIPDGVHAVCIASQPSPGSASPSGERACVFFRVESEGGACADAASSDIVRRRIDDEDEEWEGVACDKRIVMVLRWDEANEQLVNVFGYDVRDGCTGNGGEGTEEMRAYQRGIRRGELNGMGPCPDAVGDEASPEWQRWLSMICHVNDRLLRRIGIRFGEVLRTCDEPVPFDIAQDLARAVAEIERREQGAAGSPPPSDHHHRRAAKEESKSARANGPVKTPGTNSTQDAGHGETVSSPRYKFTRPVGIDADEDDVMRDAGAPEGVPIGHAAMDLRRPSPFMTAAAITSHNMDGSLFMLSLLAPHAPQTQPSFGSSSALLGELALSFILFMLVLSAEGFHQWKLIVTMMCSCIPKLQGVGGTGDSSASLPLGLFNEFVTLLTAQVRAIGDDFFVEADLAMLHDSREKFGGVNATCGTHFLVRSLSRLERGVDDLRLDMAGRAIEDDDAVEAQQVRCAAGLLRSVMGLKELLYARVGVEIDTVAFCDGEEYEPVIVYTEGEQAGDPQAGGLACGDADGAADEVAEDRDGGDGEQLTRMSWMLGGETA